MKSRSLATLPLSALLFAALGVTTTAHAQPVPPAAAAPPAAPAAPAPAPGAPATTGVPPGAFELREAPTGGLLTGKDALRAEAGGLTADEVAARAVAESPEVMVATAKVRAAAAKVDSTVVMFLPRVKVSATYRRTSPTEMSFGSGALVGAMGEGPIVVRPCAPETGIPGSCATVLGTDGLPIGAKALDFPSIQNQYLLNATVGIPISDYVLRLSNAMKGARIYEESARLGERAARVAAAANARVAYYDWLRAVAAVAVAESSLTRTQAVLADTKTAFELGAATRADVMRLESMVAGTEQMVTETRGFRRLTAERLATVMNQPSAPYRVGEDVLAPPPPPISNATTEALVAEAQRQRLELQSLEAAVRSMDRGVKALRVGQYPRLDAFGDYTYGRPNPTVFPQQPQWDPSWALGLSLSYTLNDPLDSRTKIAEVEAQKAELEANRIALERGLRMEVTSAVIAAENARTAVATASRGAAAAAEGYRVSRELYRAGRATTTDVMGAEGELVTASLREVNALLDVRVADAKLQHALGRDVAAATRR